MMVELKTAPRKIGDTLTLSPTCWYALQIVGPIDAAVAWEAATPVFMTDVTPLKTGAGLSS